MAIGLRNTRTHVRNLKNSFRRVSYMREILQEAEVTKIMAKEIG